MLDRRKKALERNYFRLMEKLQKSTQAWTSKLTGIQHWKPETGYDVFVFDPNDLGETYVLFRRWNEPERTFDEVIKKHKTGHTEPAQAVQATKDWVSNNWESLKIFSPDSNKPATEPKEEEGSPEIATDGPQSETVFQAEIKEAYEDVSEEELCRFENFLDDGVQTDDDREAMWKHPWLRRINTQLTEMGKDYSQYERAMQQRRDNALEKSFSKIMEKVNWAVKKELSND